MGIGRWVWDQYLAKLLALHRDPSVLEAKRKAFKLPNNGVREVPSDERGRGV